MSLALAARFARREMRGGLRGFRLFLACLALGVAAIAAVGSVRAAIEAGLAREGAALLGGAAELDFTYRFASPEERAWMAARATAVSEIVEFRSMAVVGDDRALTQIKGVDNLYPLVGEMVLDPAMPLDQALSEVEGLPGAVMERALSDRLGLTPGDTFRLGIRDYRLSALILREPDSAASGFALGPRTLLHRDALEGSGLLAPGTLYNSKYRLDLPQGTDLAAMEGEAEAQFENAGMRWTDARNGAPGVARFVERLSAFLVLVGLSGLAVGGVGVSAAVRSYLQGKTGVIATLRALGAERSTIFQTYFIQIGVLSLLGVAIGVVLGGLVPLLLSPVIAARLPLPASFALYPAPLIEAALYGLLTALAFTLWPLARSEDVRAATLFRDAWAGARRLPAAKYLLAIAALAAALVGLAGWFNGSWRLTLWTLGGIAGALLILVLAAMLLRVVARGGARLARGRPRLRWALAALAGPGEGAGAVVLSLGLGLSVLAAVGQIDGNLRQAIAGNLPDVAPSYFFVDIQRDQMPGYTQRLENDPAVSRIQSAPMLRGVITRINGKPAREVAGDHWVVRGDRGVTYAAKPGADARITAGEWWAEDYDGPPLISFVAEEAEEMGLKLGDTLTINVLGRDIKGTIASLSGGGFFHRWHRLCPDDEPRGAGRCAAYIHLDRLCRGRGRSRHSARSGHAIPQYHRDPGAGRHRPGVRRAGKPCRRDLLWCAGHPADRFRGADRCGGSGGGGAALRIRAAQDAGGLAARHRRQLRAARGPAGAFRGQRRTAGGDPGRLGRQPLRDGNPLQRDLALCPADRDRRGAGLCPGRAGLCPARTQRPARAGPACARMTQAPPPGLHIPRRIGQVSARIQRSDNA